MSRLTQIPTVAGFVGDGNYRYVVVELNVGDETKTVIRMKLESPDHPSPPIEHQRIGYRCMDEMPAPINVGILGGGMFGKSGEQAILCCPMPVWGREPDPDLTVRLFNEAFPGCVIEKQLGYDE